MKKSLQNFIPFFLFIPLVLGIIKTRKDFFVYPSVNTQRSLNNIDSITATFMISKFNTQHTSDIIPQVVSFWIPKNMLHSIVLLLNKEKNGKSGIGSTDGLRIYFAYDLSAGTGNYITKIILVSTYDNGVFSGSTRRHKDYYSHSLTDGLFSLVNYGTTSIGNSTQSVPGALLFEVCSNCTDSPNCSPSNHSITRANAEIMVHNFYQHPHPIQTSSEWFDLNLLNYLDNDHSSNGIRIYLGSTNSSSSWTPGSGTIFDRFIITDTMLNPVNNASTDNFSCSGNISPQTNTLNSSASGTGSGVSGTPPQDEGELCPQNCN